MYAIVEIAGLQYKVEKDQRLYVNRLNLEEGAKVKFDRVLLIDSDGKVEVGAPVIDGAKVEATVNGEVKGDKVMFFLFCTRSSNTLSSFPIIFIEIVIDILNGFLNLTLPENSLPKAPTTTVVSKSFGV